MPAAMRNYKERGLKAGQGHLKHNLKHAMEQVTLFRMRTGSYVTAKCLVEMGLIDSR